MDIFNNLNAYTSQETVGNTYEDIEKFLLSKGYNLTELSAILREQETQQIVTGAGSGKTTAIIWKALADIKTGNSMHEVTQKGMTTKVSDRIWISTFLKSGADDLESTFLKKKEELGIDVLTNNVVFSTLHAEFKRALNAMGIETPIMPSGSAVKLMAEVAKDFGLGSNRGYPKADELASIVSYVSAARNMLNPEEFYHEDMLEVGLTEHNLKYVIEMYQRLREKYRTVDFEDLQELLYKYAVNPETRNVNVTNFLANRYDKIIIDEFQDVSEIQYEILKVYAKNVKSVVAVGDDDQSIYSWRGSKVDIITKHFKEDFNPVINKLSVNYRCPSNILDPIAKSIVKNENRYQKTLKSAVEGGELNCFAYKSTLEMARSTQEQVAKDISEGKTVAILARTNASLLPLSVYFDFKPKFSFAIRGTLYDLNRIKFKRYWRLAYLFTNSELYLADNIKLLGKDIPRYKINDLVRVLKTEGLRLIDLSKRTLMELSPHLFMYVEYLNTIEDRNAVSLFKATLEWLKADLVNDKGDIGSEESLSILELLDMIIEEGEVKTIDDFLYEIDNRNQKLKARSESNVKTVTLTTVHDFKGKEADSVYIWKDTQSQFPSSRSADQDFEEERRVHYIACTRARHKSTILTIAGEESPFIEEMEIKPVAFIGEGVKRQFEKSPVDNAIDEIISSINKE